MPTVSEVRQQLLAILVYKSEVLSDPVNPLGGMEPAHMFLIASRKDQGSVLSLRKSKLPEVLTQLTLQMVLDEINVDNRFGLHLTNRPPTLVYV